MAIDPEGRLGKGLDTTRDLTPAEKIIRDYRRYAYVYNRNFGYIEEIPLKEYKKWKENRKKKKNPQGKKNKLKPFIEVMKRRLTPDDRTHPFKINQPYTGVIAKINVNDGKPKTKVVSLNFYEFGKPVTGYIRSCDYDDSYDIKIKDKRRCIFIEKFRGKYYFILE